MLDRPVSYLGSPIKVTEEARYKESSRFFRVASNIGLSRRKSTLSKFCRYIRYGFLSVQDAQDLLLGRLPLLKLRRYQLAKYWIRNHFLSENWFYFYPSMLWREKDAEAVNITVFP